MHHIVGLFNVMFLLDVFIVVSRFFLVAFWSSSQLNLQFISLKWKCLETKRSCKRSNTLFQKSFLLIEIERVLLQPSNSLFQPAKKVRIWTKFCSFYKTLTTPVTAIPTACWSISGFDESIFTLRNMY